ncbi:LamG-like jellyroll fold domain-containing protein [Marivirga sp.]|uniref:LamG-like jellyroll fold domain-containing protein n=1 Tax=Marivirga sp. TaxID=2018662 RepID=UPI003DA6F530
MKNCYLTLLLAFFFSLTNLNAQVFDVNDPIIDYDENNPPPKPPSNVVAKWVRTPGVSWNTQKWKSYIINGVPFRLRFPNNYDPNRSEKYPMIVLLHGLGFQNGDIYMNERHLNNSGAKAYEDGINSNKYDGFVLSPQASGGWFNSNHVNSINTIIRQAEQDLNFDVNRVSLTGRSGGAQSVWIFIQDAPKTYAAAAPMAGVKSSSTDNIDAYKHMPLWIFQGELDDGPSPFTTENIIDQIIAKNGNVRYTKYKNAGHGIFDKAYAESDYFDFYNEVHKANPAVLYGEYVNVFEDNKKWVYEFLEKNELCAEDAIDVRLGLTAGFDDYEWRKDGQLIAGANSNEYVATSYGIYEARIKRGDTWSDWSPSPVEIKLKDPTSTPDIQLVENVSHFLPSLDGATSVKLELPQGYANYEWRNDFDDALVGSSRVFEAISPGDYKALVAENFGCSSEFSNIFSVKDANASNGPKMPLALNGVAISKTEIKLVWSLDLGDVNPATELEIYRGMSEAGPFEYVQAVSAEALEFVDSNLDPNSTYYYKVRTINAKAASNGLASDAITTLVDQTAPSAPSNLTLEAVNSYSVSLIWQESTDDVAVYRYDIYRDGVKVTSVDTTAATVFNLQSNKIYKFRVKARDLTGNESPFSNRIVSVTSLNNESITNLKFEGDVSDNSGNNISSSISGQPSFSTLEKIEGSSSLEFNGNGYVDIDRNDVYIHEAFNERSIAFWIKQSSDLGIQDIFDEGGSVNGVAMRINNGDLEFAIRNGSVQRTLVAPIALNQWTHIAGVFNNGEAYLYVDGIKVDEDLNLPYNTIDGHGNDAGVGGTNSSNAFNQTSGGLIGYIDDFYMFNTPLSESSIQDIMDVSGVISIPDEEILPPENITATTISYESIQLDWDDVSDNEIQFQIYRSKEGGTMQAIAILPANSTSFTDSGLEPATKYIYQIEALTEYNSVKSAQSMIPSLARLKFEDNLTDESGNNIDVQNNGDISYVNDNIQGSKAISFDGSSILNLDNGNQFIHTAFTERSVSFWFKSLDVSGNQDIYDEGGSTNGFAIRLIDSDLQLTTQNGHAIFSVQAPVSRNEWHHVMGVYQAGALRLYIDGTLVASRSDLTYTSVNTHGDAGGLGGTNGSNAFDQVSGNFTGYIDDFYAFDQAMDDQIQDIMLSANPGSEATTDPLPSAPVAVSNLELDEVGLDFVSLIFTDESSDETHFEVTRAINEAKNFQLLKSFDAQDGGVIAFTDQNLQSHIDYYYRVYAVNAGGRSDSSEIMVTTLNSVPELDDLQDRLTIRYDSEYDVNIYGNDADGDQLSITGTNLPSFASLVDYGDGSGLLRFTPSATDTVSSPYSGIVISLSDDFGGVSSDTLTLEVNNNHLPTITTVADVTLEEGGNSAITLEANDVEGSSNLSWEYGLPSFATMTVNIDGSAEIDLSPGYSDHGNYNASITVSDQDGASATTEFVIVVTDKNPNTIVQVNFTDGSLLGGAGWNNTSGHPVQGDTYTNLEDITGSASGFAVSISSNWTTNGSNTLGSTTGDNSGVFPDDVMQSAYWTASGTEEVTIGGLDDTKQYELSFFGSRYATNDRSTSYTVGGQTVVLDAASNTSETVSLTTSPSGGIITVEIARAGGSSYGYLNALVLEERYDNGEAPAEVRNLSAVYNQESSEVELSWSDQAFNELSYKVYRAESVDGTYDLLATQKEGSTSYSDATVSANQEYYYKIGSSNAVGENLSQAVSISIPNVAPVITEIADASLSIGASLSISVEAKDAAEDVISLSIEGLPSFGSFTDQGSGDGSLTFSPSKGEAGVYTITVVASDGIGESRESFELRVEEEGLHHYYINFAGSTNYSSPSPWNNYLGSGAAGSTLNNISSDVAGENILMLSLETGWNGYNTNGEVNTGLYPNNVTSTALWVSSTQERIMTLEGLSNDKAYDFTFYASRSGGGDRTIHYSINNESVSLDASYNVDNTVTIEGVIPNADGTITISFEKASSASYGYVNAMVVKGYQAASIPATPSNLVATPISSSAIKLDWHDNTNLETGYELMRSENRGSSYSLLASLGPDITTYTDASSIQAGVTYYYKVRALLGEGPSDYSNITGASVYNMVSKMNFNAADPEGSPWNNTNNVPEGGAVYTDLKDDKNNNTGIAFEVVASNPAYDISLYGFNGDNPFGMNTGDNSGIVPDNVMRSTWWMDQGKTAQLRFYNLDLSQVYQFSFFASRDGNGNRTTVYSVNGKSVKLNAANNVNDIVSLDNLRPDDNGELLVTITTDEGASYSYLGAIIISSSNAIDPSIAMRTKDEETEDERLELELSQKEILKLYPNPYNERQGDLQLYLGSVDRQVEVTVLNLRGQRVYHSAFEDDSKLRKVGLSGLGTLKSGVYMMQVKGDQSGLQTIRFIKE